MKINKAQGQSLPGTLGVDLHGQCFLFVDCMLLFRGLKTCEMNSFLQPMVPTEQRMLYFRNYLACATIFLNFANQ